MMKKSLLVLPVLVMGAALLLPATQTEARSSKYRTSWKERVCNYLEKREIRAWKKFDQDNDRRVRQVQRAINIQDRFNCVPDGTIVEQIVEREQFSLLATALTEATLEVEGEDVPLVNIFNAPGEYTVFAPTNQAFETLVGDLGLTVEQLLALPNLTTILGYHVLDTSLGSVDSTAAIGLASDASPAPLSLPMFAGGNVEVTLDDGKLFINNAQVIVTDIQTTNGIVHVIDTVLLPS
jgi:uncharacterized surface protein with fasciclin (FAS1) repeats